MAHRYAHFAAHSRGGHSGHHGGRQRARRGAVVEAVLILLGERPMHGYELINELTERSSGRWQPSPGTIYPALGRMEARGLVESDGEEGTKRLTDAGRERLAALEAERGESPAPWDEFGAGGRGDLRAKMAELVGQARQIGRFGTPEQYAAAIEVLDDTKRRLYAILATEPASSDDDS
ncbi:MAG: helix-turn-helix transcriptional regulator [Ilumatobacter sp.]